MAPEQYIMKYHPELWNELVDKALQWSVPQLMKGYVEYLKMIAVEEVKLSVKEIKTESRKESGIGIGRKANEA